MSHHWQGETPDPENFFGFVYVIEHVPTGRKYVGRKNFWLKQSKKGCKSATPDKGSPKWKDVCWKESDWRTYKGSSKNVRDAMNEDPEGWTYTIIKQCRSRGILTYCEVEEQWERKVLHALLPDGTYEYMNRQIGAVKFRPPKAWSEETRKKQEKLWTDPEYRAKMSKARIGNTNAAGGKGKVISEEQKEKLRKASTGKVFGPPSEETRARISEAQKKVWAKKKGNERKQSPEHVAKRIAATMKTKGGA